MGGSSAAPNQLPTQQDVSNGTGQGLLSKIVNYFFPQTSPTTTALPKPDLSTDQSLAVRAVRDNSGLTGQAARALINHNRDIDAAIDAASGGAPTVAPPTAKGPGM